MILISKVLFHVLEHINLSRISDLHLELNPTSCVQLMGFSSIEWAFIFEWGITSCLKLLSIKHEVIYSSKRFSNFMALMIFVELYIFNKSISNNKVLSHLTYRTVGWALKHCEQQLLSRIQSWLNWLKDITIPKYWDCRARYGAVIRALNCACAFLSWVPLRHNLTQLDELV